MFRDEFFKECTVGNVIATETHHVFTTNCYKVIANGLVFCYRLTNLTRNKTSDGFILQNTLLQG